MQYLQVNEAKIQKMFTTKLEKQLQLLNNKNEELILYRTAIYINQLFPNLLIESKSTLILGGKKRFREVYMNESSYSLYID